MTPDENIFSKGELQRYNRHIIIPEFGIEAQCKLKLAKVLVIGAGSPVLPFLAAAGVGTIGIVDHDVVEDNDLHPQIFDISEVGIEKVEAARHRLHGWNPYININTHSVQLTSKNALELTRQYDVVADGTDNFHARYLVNDACVLLNKTNVYASIFQFDGQVSVFNYCNSMGERGPNYRDLFVAPPPPGLVPNGVAGGVLGVLLGIIGSMQALEVIKVITGLGEILDGRLFLFDALTFESRILNIKRNPANPLNGENPTIKELIDYEQFSGAKTMERKVREITVWDLYDWQVRGEDFQLIDVREKAEYKEANMSGLLIPLGTMLSQAEKISRDKKVVIHSKSGSRSTKAIRELEDHLGFNNLYNLKGGITAYLNEVQPVHGNF